MPPADVARRHRDLTPEPLRTGATTTSVIAPALQRCDETWKVATLEHGWGATTVARLGELIDAAPLPGFVAIDDDERVGLLTFAERAAEIEVVTIDALVPRHGVGEP